jgi:aldehyde dehydrogenase (NAD+)
MHYGSVMPNDAATFTHTPSGLATPTTVSRPALTTEPIPHPEEFFIGGEWVKPSSDATIAVIDSGTEQLFFRIAEAQAADMSRAVAAAWSAFHEGPWPRMTHTQRAEYLRALATGIRERAPEFAQIWPRETGVVHTAAVGAGAIPPGTLEFYAGLADTYPFDEPVRPTRGGKFGLIVREPVGVVAAIIPWNGPLAMIATKIAPALLAGCTVVLKSAPEAPGEANLVADIAKSIGLPPGVLNVVTADREVSELLVRDSRVDKVTFTGSTAAGRRIASLCGERVARYTLELGGKSAALILDDFDIETAANTLAAAECMLTGQVCASLTRIIVAQNRHDELVDALASAFSKVQVGDQFDAQTQMGPLSTSHHRDRVEGYIAKGVEEGATLASGGGRPRHLDRGWFVEPTLFADVDNASTIAQEEIFGPVLCVIPANDEAHAISLANDTIYGLNASVFTNDVDRALDVARQLRSGTVGHNAVRMDFGIAFGGFKQSGIGREGGYEGLQSFLETKTVILGGHPAGSATSPLAT